MSSVLNSGNAYTSKAPMDTSTANVTSQRSSARFADHIHTVQTAGKSNERDDETPNAHDHNVSISVSQNNENYWQSNQGSGSPPVEAVQSLRVIENAKNNNSDLCNQILQPIF